MLAHLQTDNIGTTSYTVNISNVSKSIKINIEKSIPFPNSILAEHLFTLLYCIVLRCMVVADSASPWTVAHQVSLSMGFSWQEYWSGLPCPPPGLFPAQGWNVVSCLAGGFFTTSNNWEALSFNSFHCLLESTAPTVPILELSVSLFNSCILLLNLTSFC